MELRVVVAACNVPVGRRHKTVRLHPRTPPGRGVVAPGLKELRLHPVQRRPHRRVVHPHHRLVVVKQRLQRHRLRRREGAVPARAVLELAVHDPAEADIPARHMALEHLHEPAPAYPFRQTQRLPLPRRASGWPYGAPCRSAPGTRAAGNPTLPDADASARGAREHPRSLRRRTLLGTFRHHR